VVLYNMSVTGVRVVGFGPNGSAADNLSGSRRIALMTSSIVNGEKAVKDTSDPTRSWRIFRIGPHFYRVIPSLTAGYCYFGSLESRVCLSAL